MQLFKIWSKQILTFGFVLLTSISQATGEFSEKVTMYTRYTKISVPPGEIVEYSVDVINNSTELKNIGISLEGIPRGWEHSIMAGSYTISQLAVLPGERKNFSLKITIPLKVNKGNYRFKVLAGGLDTLPLTINVSEQGTFKTEFTTGQSNMQGSVKSNFTFNAKLDNRTAEQQQYALMANAPQGWSVTFRWNGQQVTSVNTEPNSTNPVTIEIKAPEKAEAGKYEIPIRAATSVTSADLKLEVVITGSYAMELTTPTGLLSTNITAGETRQITLQINNTGSSPLINVTPSYSAPANWSVTFDPKNIERIETGKSAQVMATIKADKKAIPGDYVTNIDVKTAETSDKAQFRISVETSMLWGWVGIFIILAALAGVYQLFRKYGRR